MRSFRKRSAIRVKETTMATDTIIAFEVQPFRIDVPEGGSGGGQESDNLEEATR